MWKTTIKGLMAHKLRLALTGLAVVLGVGFIAGTYVLTDTMNATFDNLFADTTRGVDVVVRSENAFESETSTGEGEREPMPEGLVQTIEDVDGVEEANGSVSGFAQIVDKNGDAITPNGPPTLGFNWFENEESAVELRTGEAPTSPTEVAIDAATARNNDFELGDRVQVLLQGPSRTFTLVGTIGVGEADNLAGATIAAFETETAQTLFDKEGLFDTIEVSGTGGTSAGELRSRIAGALPEGYEALTGEAVADEQAQSLQEALSFFNTALLAFGFIALFVGAFIIFNTFSIVVAQRTRELALLRALGATGRQVMASVFVESAIVGLLASIVGLGAGIGIALGLQALLSSFGIELPSTDLQFEPRTAIVAIVVGVVVTVLSAIAPARRAARIAPMEALRESGPRHAPFSRRRLLAGAIVTVVGAVLLGYGLVGGPNQPIIFVGTGAALVFFGVAVLSPLFAAPLARALGAPMQVIFHMPGRLARRNASRNAKRTASTAAALMIGVALVGMVSVLASSIKASSSEALDETLRADFILTSAAGAGGVAPIGSEVARRVAERAEIGAVAPLRFGEFRVGGETRGALATDPGEIEDTTSLSVEEGTISDLEDGGVFVSAQEAEDENLAVGDELAMEFPKDGVVPQRVEGVFENTDLVGNYLISLDTYNEHYAHELDNLVLATTAGGSSTEEARSAIDSVLADFPNVAVSNQAEFKEEQAGMIDQLLALVTALLALALIIAVLGITNTLVLSVFERTRELGLLRAVGMSRRQTRSMIRWESVIIAVIGALLGLVVGIAFGSALVMSLADEGFSEVVFPGGQLVTYVLLAGVAGVLAALPPARRAARLNVLEAIATE